MKTKVDYENMTDEELGKLISDKLELGTNAFGRIGVATFTYATSLDACREAIEKFCKNNQCLFQIEFNFDGSNGHMAYILPYGPKSVGKEGNLIQHKNPARAACIAMLMALEKGKE